MNSSKCFGVLKCLKSDGSTLSVLRNSKEGLQKYILLQQERGEILRVM